jgi:hypothetical protein
LTWVIIVLGREELQVLRLSRDLFYGTLASGSKTKTVSLTETRVPIIGTTWSLKRLVAFEQHPKRSSIARLRRPLDFAPTELVANLEPIAIKI